MRNEKFLREFDWNLLFTFLVIEEGKSVTAAASRLHRTQSIYDTERDVYYLDQV